MEVVRVIDDFQLETSFLNLLSVFVSKSLIKYSNEELGLDIKRGKNLLG